jgi:hypothetical protein
VPHAARATESLTWVPADAARLAAVLSLVAGALVHGVVGAALFFLVLGGTILPRAFGVPAALDWSYCLVIIAAGWAAQLDWYQTVPGLDLVVHATATGLVALVGHHVLSELGLFARVDDPRLLRPRLGAGVVTVSLGMTLAVLWELGEWFGHTVVDDRIQIGYQDTVGDLAAGGLGVAVAALVLLRGPLGAGGHR